MEFAGVDKAARSKMGVWKMHTSLPHRAELSTPTNSNPAIWCRIVYSCFVHSRKFSVPMLMMMIIKDLQVWVESDTDPKVRVREDLRVYP